MSRFGNMGSGNVALLLCLIVGSVLPLSNGQCGQNEELSVCYDACNTCEQRGSCPDCSVEGCNCRSGYLRNDSGTCVEIEQCGIMKTMAAESEIGEKEPLVQESGGCPYRRRCSMSCNRRGFWYGVCVGRGRRRCQCVS